MPDVVVAMIWFWLKFIAGLIAVPMATALVYYGPERLKQAREAIRRRRDWPRARLR